MKNRVVQNSQHSTQIIRLLEKASSGRYRSSDIFDDWLEIVHATLIQIPNHLKNMNDGLPLDDLPDTEKLFGRMRSRHSARAFDCFSRAFAVLLESTMVGFADVLGETYMAFANPNPSAGQFFSPMPLAQTMAMGLGHDIETQVKQRIMDAIAQTPLAKSAAIAGSLLDEEQLPSWYFGKVLPLALPNYEPYKIMDPACGSGVMLLAAAEQCPAWILNLNLVRFYGMDIDETCARMARVNLMTRGLNGYTLCALYANNEQLAALPHPYAAKYAEARDANLAGNSQRVLEILEDVRQLKQSTLF